jgi:hypothetical protein
LATKPSTEWYDNGADSGQNPRQLKSGLELGEGPTPVGRRCITLHYRIESEPTDGCAHVHDGHQQQPTQHLSREGRRHAGGSGECK